MTSPLPAYNSVVASATVLKPQKSLSPQYESWQEQLWEYFDLIGEFEAAVGWKANSLSRVRLLAAELSNSGEEPEPLTEGPAAEIMERFAGGTGGQAQLMREMVTHLSVPGEGWMVGEAGDPRQGAVEGEEHWFVASADELRVATKGGAFELKTGEGRNDWRQLSTNSMVVRVWQPHPRFGYQATSDARHAIGAMLELDLVNKRIIADITSRLASNGILLYDKERLSFGQTQNTPVPDDAEKPDPFAEQLVAVAGRGISDAMSPEAVIPLPIGYSLGEGLSGVDPKLLMQHITFGGGLDPKLLDQRNAAIKRLATNLDIPADVLLGLGDMNHWCVPDTTEIFTRDRGWVTRDNLSVGDEVRTLDVTTGQARWEPVQDIATFDVDELPMLKMSGRLHSSLSTRDHRWVVERDGATQVVRSRELDENDRLIRGAAAVELPAVAKYDDAFVELVAWQVTDGTCTRDRQTGAPFQVRIAQSHRVNAHLVDQLRGTLTRLWGPPASMRDSLPTWREEYRDDGMTLFVLNQHARDALNSVMTDPFVKAVDREFIHSLTRSQLELFIHTYVTGDGHRRGDAFDVRQHDERRLESIELAAVLAGRTLSYSQVDSGGFRRVRVTSVHLGSATGADAKHTYERVRVGKQRSTETYTGTIWCPVTPSGTWLARSGGHVFYTGNSAWNVEESGIKIHIAPTAELISYSLTTGYLRPMLQSQNAPLVGPNGNPIVVWYDPSEITVRPDRSQSTIAAYDRLEVPGRVLRRELGLSEEADQPTPQELQELIGRFLVRQPVTSLTALANMAPDGRVTVDGTEDVVPTGGAGDTDTEEPPAEADTGGTDIPEQPAPGEAPPAAASGVDVAQLDSTQLIKFAALANDELIRRRGPVSAWVDAEEPNVDALRKPRNGSRAEVS